MVKTRKVRITSTDLRRSTIISQDQSDPVRQPTRRHTRRKWLFWRQDGVNPMGEAPPVRQDGVNPMGEVGVKREGNNIQDVKKKQNT